MISRRDVISDFIKKRTIEILDSGNINGNGVEAEEISYELKIDRANVSRELNTLWKNGYLIKIAGRPVFYMDIKIVSNAYQDIYIPTFIPKGVGLSDYINTNNTYQSPFDNELDLENMIGSNGSLSHIIEKAKAAVFYPPYGLHTLITGNSGTEKSTLANSMVKYAIKNGIKNKRCPYYDIDCRRANANIAQFEEKLFGYQDEDNRDNSKKGILEMCTNGFLLLQNIDYLPQSTTDLISSLLNKGYFTRINSNTPIPAKFMMILISAKSLTDPELYPYVHYITTLISIPNMDDRGVYEKLEMIMDCFARESRKIHKSILVSKDVIVCFARKIYKENITKLENEIRDACSKAYVESLENNSNEVNVNLTNLPEEITDIPNSIINRVAEKSSPFLLNIIKDDALTFDNNGQSEQFDLFKQFPSNTSVYLKNQFIKKINQRPASFEQLKLYINDCIKIIHCTKRIYLKEILKVINPYIINIVNQILFQHSEYNFFKKNQEYLYPIYFYVSNITKRSQNICSSYNSYFSKSNYHSQYRIVEEIFNKINKKEDLFIDRYDYDYCALYFYEILHELTENKIGIIVIARGKSVASQIIDYVKDDNKDIDNLMAIDYSKDMNLNECFEEACSKAVEINRGAGVLFFVDELQLSNIDAFVNQRTGIPSKTAYPFTLNKLIHALDLSKYSLDSFDNIINYPLSNGEILHNKGDFIINLIQKNIFQNFQFIEPYKALRTLDKCLNSTLSILNLQYTDEFAYIYFANGVEMLERVLRNEQIDNKKIYKFISKYPAIIKAMSRGLEHANSVYHIRISQTEIACLAEKLLPFINKTEN